MLQLVVELATSDVDVIGETRDVVDAGGAIGEAAAGRLDVDAVQKGSDGPSGSVLSRNRLSCGWRV